MKVKLVFDAQFVGRLESIIDLPEDITNTQIENLFQELFGISYDTNCSHYIIKNV